MAGTKVEEAIVEDHEEIGGRRKRVNGDKDSLPAKRAKVEGNEAADSRNLEGEAAGDREEEENLKGKLRGLLEDDPKKLTNKDVEDVIRYLDVDEIISLALKSKQGNGSGDDGEVEKWTEDEGECEKVLVGAVRRMLCYIEGVKRSELKLLYEKWSPNAFAMLLLAALDSYSIRRLRGGVPFVKLEERDVSKLSCVLPWKLFAHILCEKRWVPALDEETDVEDEEESTAVQKEAAVGCGICLGEGRHLGRSGSYCTFQDAIPIGTTVGPDYCTVCSQCGFSQLTSYFGGCLDCGCEVGQAKPIPSLSFYCPEQKI